jgi:hypothetical protein
MSTLPDLIVKSKFSLSFYIFVMNYLTKNWRSEGFFEDESILMLVISFVPVPSFQG